MRGVNDDEIVDFAAFGRDQGVVVRFIEFMPLDAQGAWNDEQVVTAGRDPRARSTPCSRSSPLPAAGAQPAEQFRYPTGSARSG